MPFKTKRHKISAAERRFSFGENGAVSYGDSSPDTEAAGKKTKPAAAAKDTREIENLSYVKGDLAKIVTVASLIIAVQIFLKIIL